MPALHQVVVHHRLGQENGGNLVGIADEPLQLAALVAQHSDVRGVFQQLPDNPGSQLTAAVDQDAHRL